MKPQDVGKALERLEQTVGSLSLALTIESSKIDALTQELAEALRRQGIDPQPFLKRIQQRASETAREEVRKKEKLRDQIRKINEDDDLV